MAKKKILVFIDWYLPGYKAGGPIRSVSNLISDLQHDFDFLVFTRNSDLGEIHPYENIISDKWTFHSGNYPVYYASPKSLSLKNVFKILSETEYDTLYLNGIFSFRFSILPLLFNKILRKKHKVIVSPRGMLGAGAISMKKWKKKIFLSLARFFGVYREVTWHASTVHEEKEILATFGAGSHVVNAMNISRSSGMAFISREKNKGEVRLFFLSRISPKKNLTGALMILKQIKTGNVNFDIYGPIEDEGYWKECEPMMNSFENNIQVKYKGILQPEMNQKVLSGYHFLLLPTFNENYGHVIFESLAAGCPVIISNLTPWKNLEEKKIGWEISLENQEKFIRVIEQGIAMDQEEFNEWSECTHRYAVQISNNSDIIELNRRLFLNS